MAGLEKQYITVGVHGGLDLKTDAKQVESPKTLQCDNLMYISEKQLVKRSGYKVKLDNINARQVVSTPAELLYRTNDTLYAFDVDDGSVVPRGFISPAQYEQDNVVQTQTLPTIEPGSQNVQTVYPPEGAQVFKIDNDVLICWHEMSVADTVQFQAVFGAGGDLRPFGNIYYGVISPTNNAWVIPPVALGKAPNGVYSDPKWVVVPRHDTDDFQYAYLFYIVQDPTGLFNLCYATFRLGRTIDGTPTLTLINSLQTYAGMQQPTFLSGQEIRPIVGYDVIPFPDVDSSTPGTAAPDRIAVAYGYYGLSADHNYFLSYLVPDYGSSGDLIPTAGSPSPPIPDVNAVITRIALAFQPVPATQVPVSDPNLYLLAVAWIAVGGNAGVQFYDLHGGWIPSFDQVYVTTTAGLSPIAAAWDYAQPPTTAVPQCLYVTVMVPSPVILNTLASTQLALFRLSYDGVSPPTTDPILVTPPEANALIRPLTGFYVRTVPAIPEKVLPDGVTIPAQVQDSEAYICVGYCGGSIIASQQTRTLIYRCAKINSNYKAVVAGYQILNSPTEVNTDTFSSFADIEAPGMAAGKGGFFFDNNGQACFVIPNKGSTAFDAIHYTGVLSIMTFTALPTFDYPVVNQGLGLLFPGACPTVYDGIETNLAGFLTGPELYAPDIDDNVEGGGLQPNTNYAYCACYVRTDAYGNVYRSTPGPIIYVLTGPAPGGAGFGSTATFWSRPPPIVGPYAPGAVVELYRSFQPLNTAGPAEATGATSQFHLVAIIENMQVTQFVDTMLDDIKFDQINDPPDTLIDQPQLYTNVELGSPPANMIAPPMNSVIYAQNRYWAVSAEFRNRVYYTQPVGDAPLGPQWSLFQFGVTDESTGPIAALGQMDDYVAALKLNTLYVISGITTDKTTPSQMVINPIQRLPFECGCTDPGSVINTSEGLYFKGTRGIVRLNRDLRPEYVGLAVDVLTNTVVSAQVFPELEHVRFFTAQGQTLVFDYILSRWSTFSEQPMNSQAFSAGVWYYLTADGTEIRFETPGLYRDGQSGIQLTLQPAWVKPAKIVLSQFQSTHSNQGWGRVYRMALLGDFKSQHLLNVAFQFDYNSIIRTTAVFNTKTGLITGDSVYQFRMSRMPRQVMQAVLMTFTDATTGIDPLYESCTISNLVYEVGVKSGLAKLPPRKTL